MAHMAPQHAGSQEITAINGSCIQIGVVAIEGLCTSHLALRLQLSDQGIGAMEYAVVQHDLLVLQSTF